MRVKVRDMINKRDLIDNYFHIIDRSNEIHLPIEIPFKVLTVGFSICEVVRFDQNPVSVPKWREVAICDLSPIPLTSDWLVRFGWGKGDIDTQYVDNISLFDDVLCYTVDSNVLHIESSRDCIELNHIKHVHQLQNLYFALTGEELTIKD